MVGRRRADYGRGVGNAAIDHTTELDHDSLVVLRGASWADFQRMLDLRGDAAGPRFAYLEGMREVDITPYGAWTLENKAAQRGAEPDECYVVGSDPDPSSPDLAIEVVWTSGRLDKLQIYRKLGVREVWYWRRGKAELELFALRGDSYVPIDASEVLSTASTIGSC